MVVVVLQQDHAQSYKTDIIWSLYAYPQETSTKDHPACLKHCHKKRNDRVQHAALLCTISILSWYPPWIIYAQMSPFPVTYRYSIPTIGYSWIYVLRSVIERSDFAQTFVCILMPSILKQLSLKICVYSYLYETFGPLKLGKKRVLSRSFYIHVLFKS